MVGEDGRQDAQADVAGVLAALLLAVFLRGLVGGFGRIDDRVFDGRPPGPLHGFDRIDSGEAHRAAERAEEVDLHLAFCRRQLGDHVMLACDRGVAPCGAVRSLKVAAADLAFPSAVQTDGVHARGPSPATAAAANRVAHPVLAGADETGTMRGILVPLACSRAASTMAYPVLPALWAHPSVEKRVSLSTPTSPTLLHGATLLAILRNNAAALSLTFAINPGFFLTMSL